jgi:hypothetical protein
MVCTATIRLHGSVYCRCICNVVVPGPIELLPINRNVYSTLNQRHLNLQTRCCVSNQRWLDGLCDGQCQILYEFEYY